MEEINEIKIPQDVESMSVTEYDDKIVIKFMTKKPKFKEGDFVYEDGRIMIVKSYPSMFHANLWHTHSDMPVYNGAYAVDFSEPTFRYATDEEKQVLIDAMEKDGKWWNAEKLEIEDIPQPKFKEGDSVMIKEGISSKTHRYIAPSFVEKMDKYIGKKLIVRHAFDDVHYGAQYRMTNDAYSYAEDWLEPYTAEPKKGDLAIFWDNGKGDRASIKLYDKKRNEYHCDSFGYPWENAIKFESKEQFEKALRGEI